MEDLRLGACVRAERRRRGKRQIDVARLAGVAQQTVSQLERGNVGDLSVRVVRAICAALEIRAEFDLKSRGRDPERLADARHARLVVAVVASLGNDWRVVPEYSFNHFGDRGSVDILAWHARDRALLLIEVKSEVADLQATLRSMDVKARVVPKVVRQEQGWQARAVASILVLPDESTARRAVTRFGPAFDSALPARTIGVRRWIQAPSGPLRGVWFLADTSTRRVIRNPGSRGRIRAAEPISATLSEVPKSSQQEAAPRPERPLAHLTRPPDVNDGNGWTSPPPTSTRRR
jgi:transcriptional regulator with XRE-family HTH domain